MLENEPHFVELQRWTGWLNVVPSDVSIILACDSCGMRRPMLRRILETAAGGELNLDKIEARLRCSSCGNRNGRIVLGHYHTPRVQMQGCDQ